MRQQSALKTVIVILLLLLVVLAVAWLASSPRAGDPAFYSVAGPSSPYGLYAPGTLDELPAAAAGELIGALGLSTLADYQDYTLGLVEELGITWTRIDFLYDGKSFMVPEDYLQKLDDNGVEVVACPRAFVPLDANDLPAYEAALRRLVSEHPAIRVWQIDNEPNIGAEGSDPYLEVFLTGRRAVRETCPECRVALAGVPVLDPGRQQSLDYYDKLLGELAAREGSMDGPAFDIFDLHYYGLAGDSSGLQEAYSDYEQLLSRHGLDKGVRIWMTECATYTGKPLEPPDMPAQSEEQQAAELVERFVVLLGAGAERVAWARFYENYNYTGTGGGYFDHSGLVYNGLGNERDQGIAPGSRKQGFDAYRLLISETDGYSGVSKLADGQYRFDFNDGREPVYAVWAVGGVELADELKGPVRFTDLDGYVYEGAVLEVGEAPVFVTRL